MSSECVCRIDLDQMIMIEYPGFVKNPDKAIATMGGIQTIEKVVASQKDRLELRFRPKDPFAHPAYGDREPKKCLVLRLKKKRKNTESELESGSSNYEIDVIARVQTSYRFDTMAEFQWLPMQRINRSNEPTIDPEKLRSGFTIRRTPESLNPKYVSVLDDVLPIKDPFDNTHRNFNYDAPLLILPAVFSRFDTPREIHQPHPKFRSKEMREEFERQQSLSIIGRTRKKRSTMSCLLKNYKDPVPNNPPEELVKERAVLSSQEKILIPRLEDCFARQKVWSKAALCYELTCSTLDIKFILPLVAYHYVNGPFRTMWVKYGYNPHRDSSSRALQTLDFRVKNNQDSQEYSRRSIHQHQLPMRKNPDKMRNKHQLDLKSIITGAASNSFYHMSLDDPFDDTLNNTRGQIITESMCKFRRNLIPGARQLSYQLKDIEIDEIQAIVHNSDCPKQCSEKDGWLPEGSIDRIRKIMNRILSENVGVMLDSLEPT